VNRRSFSSLTARGAIVLAFVAAGSVVPSSQGPGQLSGVRYYSGQSVAPVFEGWEKNPDGTFSFVFGYLNRNYEEQPEIPIGPNNSFSPGAADRGQPTHFYNRRQQFMFKVNVPADFGSKELVWTLTRGGHTEKAVAHLALEWELTEIVYSQNRMGLNRDSVTAQPNKAPSVTIDGSAKATASVGTPLTLTATAMDDGVPKPAGRGRGAGAAAGTAASTGAARGAVPAAATPGAAPSTPRGPALTTVKQGPVQQAVVRPAMGGLAVTWTHWRGPGKLTFAPQTVVVKEGKASTQVTFSEPGTYVVRAYVDDGVLMGTSDVTVSVK
jgi:hypothetical protein